MDHTPITSLTPDSSPPADKSIRAIVTLSWPYSSSTRQCALLLADPDFRLRNRKGQVRVRFTGESAEAVAKSRVGIGDEVILGLNGAVWEQDSEASRTPGRSVDGELLFRRRLVLSVVRANGNVDINVDAAVSPPRSPEKPVEMATPLPKAITTLRTGLDGTMESSPSYTYTSPAFTKRLRLSGEPFLDPAYDPFAVDEREIEPWRERNWTSFGTNLRWRYSEKPPSPEKVQSAHDGVDVDKRGGVEDVQQPAIHEEGSLSRGQRSKNTMLPPPLPNLTMPPSEPVTGRSQLEDETLPLHEGPSTPKLQPIQSPTLPLPSPFPIETRQMQHEATTSPQDPRLEPEAIVQVQSQAEAPTALIPDYSRNQDVELLEPHADVYDETMQAYPSDTEPDDEFTQQMLMERHGVSTDNAITQSRFEAEMVDDSSYRIHEHDVEHAAPQESMNVATYQFTTEMPHTPEKLTRYAQRFDFGLDGTSSTPPSTHVTPQSEKDRIMAQTYRSLFGFQNFPEQAPQPQLKQLQDKEQERPKPAPRLSDMAWGRLQAAGIPTDDVIKSAGEHAVQASVPIIEDPAPSELEQQPSEQTQQLPTASVPSSQVEVIELDSSSDSESERPQEQLPVRPTSQRRTPKLEIQDSLADSENEDLLAQQTQSRQGGLSFLQAQTQASKLQNMVAEEPYTETILEEAQPAPAIERKTSAEKRLADVERDVIVQDKAETPLKATSPLSSPPPEIFQTPNDPIFTASIDPFATQKGHTISSPLSSPTPYIAEATSSTERESVDDLIATGLQDPRIARAETRTLPTVDGLADAESTKSTAPATVIELGSSSPIVPLPMSPVEAREAVYEILEDASKTNEIDSGASIEVNQSQFLDWQSEGQMKSPTAREDNLTESMHVESQEQDINLPHQVLEPPLYPSLPLSPSYSQSLLEMGSQPAAGTIPETMSTTLPPTPQLTQVESFTETHAPVTALASSSPLKVAEPSTQMDDVAKSTPTSRSQKKTPTRKSLSTRLSNVPDVISPWFSPKRTSSTAAVENEEIQKQGDNHNDVNLEAMAMQQVNGAMQPMVNGHILTPARQVQTDSLDTNGLSTPLSYFTPLFRLEELLNSSSQQSHGTNTIDVLAIVTDSTNEPVRAKAGPRDYFTVFKVSDQSISAGKDVRVEIYRPWKATLPVASVGDAILLRAFAVKSRKRQPYLLSTDASAWCVWRYDDQVALRNDDDGRPIWARKESLMSSGAREEVKGPPVELGEEERQHALRLRELWQAVQPEQDMGRKVEAEPRDPALHEHVAQPVAAKL